MAKQLDDWRRKRDDLPGRPEAIRRLVELAEGAFVGAKPSGLIRVDVHGTQARHFLLPGMPRFRHQYPDSRLHFSEAHQPLDMIRDGFDCIPRAGEPSDSPLIKRRLALLERGTFASPDYLGRCGTPQTPDDVAGHEMVGFLSPDSGDVVPLIFGAGGNARQVKLPAMVTVTGPETNVACASMGLGLIQVLRYRVASELARGALVEVLAGFPPSPLPVQALYSHTRQLSPRLRVFIDWMAEQFRDRLSPTE
jgi:DNA-binding transcriptional LysR family regulator